MFGIRKAYVLRTPNFNMFKFETLMFWDVYLFKPSNFETLKLRDIQILKQLRFKTSRYWAVMFFGVHVLRCSDNTLRCLMYLGHSRCETLKLGFFNVGYWHVIRHSSFETFMFWDVQVLSRLSIEKLMFWDNYVLWCSFFKTIFLEIKIWDANISRRKVLLISKKALKTEVITDVLHRNHPPRSATWYVCAHPCKCDWQWNIIRNYYVNIRTYIHHRAEQSACTRFYNHHGTITSRHLGQYGQAMAHRLWQLAVAAVKLLLAPHELPHTRDLDTSRLRGGQIFLKIEFGGKLRFWSSLEFWKHLDTFRISFGRAFLQI